MRILHTADWHLGRALHGRCLQQDQQHALDQVLNELQDGYDAIIIAGDVYDRAVPSPEAVDLFGGFLEKLKRRDISAVVIPGNHDSAARLGFASAILEGAGIHLRCDYSRLSEPITLASRGGEVDVFALPYVEAALMREALGDQNMATHAAATQRAVEGMLAARRPGVPAVAVAHAFVGSESLTSDSERMFIGTAQVVGAELFDGFAYAALGHLHRPQQVKTTCIRYAGSLLPYSFSEAGHAKQVIRLDVNAGGQIALQPVEIRPLHPLAIVETSFEEALESAAYDGLAESYVSVRLTDSAYHINTFSRLKERYPLLLELRQSALEAPLDAAAAGPASGGKASPGELLDLFLDHFGWEQGPEREVAAKTLLKTLQDVEARRREAVP